MSLPFIHDISFDVVRNGSVLRTLLMSATVRAADSRCRHIAPVRAMSSGTRVYNRDDQHMDCYNFQSATEFKVATLFCIPDVIQLCNRFDVHAYYGFQVKRDFNFQ